MRRFARESPQRKAANRAAAKAKREAREAQFLRLCERIGNVPPGIQQHRFDAERQWRFDFAWPAQLVAVEIEGGTFVRGKSRHTSPAGHQADCEKYNRAASMGWCVLRYTSKDLDRRPVQVLEEIQAALSRPRSVPSV